MKFVLVRVLTVPQLIGCKNVPVYKRVHRHPVMPT